MSSAVHIYENVILLVPAPVSWLRGWLKGTLGDGEAFEVFEGSGEYCGFAPREGIAMGDEMDWAEELSSRLEGAVYSLWTHDDASITVHRYEGGSEADSFYQDFFEFADSLGVQLPGKPEPRPSTENSACLVLDVRPDEVPESVIKEAESGVDISENRLGTLFAVKGASLIALSFALSEAFPEKLMYTIEKTSDGRIRFARFKGWEELGDYVIPPFELVEPSLKHIEGETDPRRIAKKLDVPLHLLGLKPSE